MPTPPMTLLRARWLPPALLAVVVVVDVVLAHVTSRLPMGVLDECGHQATSALLLLAAPPSWTRRLRPTVVVTIMAASSLIDVDHVPLYLGIIGAPGRPDTHSVLTPLALVAVAALCRGRARAARPSLLAVALGVCFHLVRDVPTGPGAPLLGPFGPSEVIAPYWTYLVLLALVSLVALAHASTRTRVPQDEPAP